MVLEKNGQGKEDGVLEMTNDDIALLVDSVQHMIAHDEDMSLDSEQIAVDL